VDRAVIRVFDTTYRRFSTAGFTLVELMIALTIGLVLLGGLVNVYVNSSRNHAELIKAAEHTGNGGMAMWTLSSNVFEAGYFGEFYLLPDPGSSLPDPCAMTAPELYAALTFPLQGYDAPAASPLACLSNGDFVSGTDILVIRNANGTALAPTDVPIANEVFGASQEEIDHWTGLVAAVEEAQKKGTAAIVYKGKMVDIAHYTYAREMLKRAAEYIGIDRR